jgi:superfamily II DNA or RNA helicase
VSLKQADIQRLYFLSGTHPIDFFSKCYDCATQLKMTLGYFSGSAFGVSPIGLLNFIENDGSISIVCNDRLFQPDIDAIIAGHQIPNRRITKDALLNLLRASDASNQFGFKALSYMLQLGTLQLKIARATTLVHFKLGLFKDPQGDRVLFTGSVNYTISGLLFNKEQIQTTPDWTNEADHVFVTSTEKQIDLLFQNQVDDIDVVNSEDLKDIITDTYPVRDFDELREDYELVKKFVATERLHKVEQTFENRFLSFPNHIQPRPYQQEAISYWVENGWSGLLSMATGTGKTLTALFALATLAKHKPNVMHVLILVPTNALVTQWTSEISPLYDGFLVTSLEPTDTWKKRISSRAILNYGSPQPSVFIFTYDSYVINAEYILSRLDQANTVLVADEVHNFGSALRRKNLPVGIKHRLGLSATPVRQYDEEGTQVLFEFFSPSSDPYEVTIGDAIRFGALVPYYYYPIIVRLSDLESEQYEALTKRIRKFLGAESLKSDAKMKDNLSKLLKQRHRILERAEGKEEALEEVLNRYIREHGALKGAIVFAPDGSRDGELYSDIYVRLLSQRSGVRVASYVSGSSASLLDGLAYGDIDVIVAKKMLDEGVNIPSIRNAFFVASSTSTREFVQRRGRVLRKSPGKTSASIFDFVAVPQIESTASTYGQSAGDSILKSEIRRMEVFAEHALNTGHALRIMNNL